MKRILIILIAIILLFNTASAFAFNASHADSTNSSEDVQRGTNNLGNTICTSEQRVVGTVEGCDTAQQITTATLLSTLISNDYCTVNFVGRYLKNATGSKSLQKELTKGELELLSGASIQILSLFELNGSDPSEYTYNNGVSHATQAVARAAYFGQPNNKPIYFCVDYSPSGSAEINAALNYFDGVNSVLSDPAQNPKGYTLAAYGCSVICKNLRSVYPSIPTMLCGTTYCFDGTYFTDWTIRQYSQKLIGSGPNSFYIDPDEAHLLSSGVWTHTHTYSSLWLNYGNVSYHRRMCMYCTHYQYHVHSPNSSYTKCLVCGYTGSIVIPAKLRVPIHDEHRLID